MMQMKEAADMAHAAQEMRELKLQTRMQLRDARAESALANESAAAASAAAMAMLTRTATVPPEPPVKAESSMSSAGEIHWSRDSLRN